MAYLLHRGEYDKRRDPVKPDTPDALPPMPADLPRNRLGLAQWLMRPEHPLTARVVVNRFWQEVFGNGLGAHRRRLRRHRRASLAPRAARLAGRRVSRIGMGREAPLPDDGRVIDLPAVGRDDAGEARERPAQSPALARAAVPDGWRDDPRRRPRLQRSSWPASWAARASSRTSPRASGKLSPCRRAIPISTSPITANGCTAAAFTPSGSAARRRRRWMSSTLPLARSAPSAANGPTLRFRPS